MNRRIFFRHTSIAVALVAAAPRSYGANLLLKAPEVTLGKLSSEMFAGLLNTYFQVGTVARRLLTLQLVQVEVGNPSSSRKSVTAGGGVSEQFSLIFTGPSAADRLPQESYFFEHPQMGRAQIFIVPMHSMDPSIHEYVATFNRLSFTESLDKSLT